MANEDFVHSATDNTPIGRRTNAERKDEPGAEFRYVPGHGIGDDEVPDMQVHAHKLIDFVSGALDMGDWSWKPHRDKRFGVEFKTFLGVPKGAAELYGPRILN